MSVGRTSAGVLYFSVRYKDDHGKTIQKKVQSTKWKTKKECKQAEAYFLASVGKSKSITFYTLENLYLDSISVRARESSIISFTYKLKHYTVFNDIDVNNISASLIEQWQKDLLSSSLADKSIYEIQALFYRILKYGLKRGYLSSFPSFDIAKRNKIEKEISSKVITKEQFDLIVGDGCSMELKTLVTLLYYTGLRIGEALPLSFDDVICGCIKVSRLYDSATLDIKPYTKTNKSRSVLVNDTVIESFKAYKDYLEKRGIKDNGRVFDSNPQSYMRMYAKRCKSLGIEPHNLHSLRHTHVSLLLSLGFTPFEISERTGHSVQMIYRIYGHNLYDPQTKMIEKLENL